MKKKEAVSPASLGLRAKTGRAIVVVLRGPVESPVVVERREWILWDSALPDTFQPYHAVMDLPWLDATQAVRETAAVVEKLARKAMKQLTQEVRSRGHDMCGVGIVGSPDRDLARIGNPHIRAHAAEGWLFRKVLEDGAKACGLPHDSFTERDLYARAAETIGLTVAQAKTRLSELGDAVGPPWRADEKAAAAAAWIILAIRA